MIKEVLRMEHIVCKDNEILELNHFSMQIFKSEIYGLLCLERHGIKKMIDLICKNLPIQYGQVFLEEKLVNNMEKGDYSKNSVTVIGSESSLIDNLTFADNLFVVGSKFGRAVIQEREVHSQTMQLLENLQIKIEPTILVEHLSAYDKLVTELLRAMVVGNHLIILWQISDLLSSEELPRFHELIRNITKRGYSFLYIYNHHEVLRPVCDRIGIFQSGRIDKVLLGQEGIETAIRSVFARYAYEKLHLLKTDKTKDFSRLPVVLTMRNVCTEHIFDWNLSIKEGENVLLIDQSNTVLNELFTLLSDGNKNYKGTLEPEDVLEKTSGKIAVIPRNPISSSLFQELSFLDNLCFPLGEKIPLFWQKASLKKSIAREYREELGGLLDAKELYGLHSKDLYTLVYYRYFITRPKLVICMQPLSGVDMYIRVHILEMINRLCNKGIAVWVLNTELYDTLYAADRVIQVENGRIIGEYSKDDFEKLCTTQKNIYPD